MRSMSFSVSPAFSRAFAAQAIAVQDELGFDPEKTNLYGGAVAHGHPVGATGVILITKLAYALRRLLR